MLKHLIIYTLLIAIPLQLHAQANTIYQDHLKTLQVKLNGEWGEPPVMLLGGQSYMEISFDDLNTEYTRYTYSITHCNADWTPSEEITLNDYLDGFNDQIIEDYQPSIATTMNYNHYFFELPNDDVKLRISGNYRVDIKVDGEGSPVASAYFSVIEPHVTISASVSGNTDIDTYASHQQLDFTINHRGYEVFNPVTDLKPVVIQNRRWNTEVSDIRPTYMRNNEVTYTHNQKLIFEAGAEYRRFEILDDHVPTMHVDSLRYLNPYIHAFLLDDKPRQNYLYDSDQDGRYYIRNYNNENNDTESDYYLTHFRLLSPQLPGGDVYLNGDLTLNSYSEMYHMQYDIIAHCYEIVLPLKQGSYNYQYLFVPAEEERGTTRYTEGNYHQTHNEYTIYVYHRPIGTRYDRLVGFMSFVSE